MLSAVWEARRAEAKLVCGLGGGGVRVENFTSIGLLGSGLLIWDVGRQRSGFGACAGGVGSRRAYSMTGLFFLEVQLWL